MSANHTPGPWKIRSGKLDLPATNETDYQIVPLDNSGIICEINTIEETGRADCALISAAPELLAALENMVAIEDARFWADDSHGLRDGIELTDLTAARAAIQKAKDGK